MRLVGLIAKDAPDAQAIAERHGWTQISLLSWKDELGRRVEVATQVEEIQLKQGIELVIVSGLAYENENYGPLLDAFTSKNVPAKYL